MLQGEGKTEQELKDLCRDVMVLKNKLASAGLWESVHAAEEVTKKVGWEVAAILTKRKKK